jgi:hypothetical protein
LDSGGFGFAKGQAGVSETDLDRVAERGEGQHFDRFAFEEPEFVQPLHETGIAGEGLNDTQLTGAKLGERGHTDTGRTMIEQSPGRRQSLHPATFSKHGLPGCTTCTRLPWRMPSSASRPTQPGWPLTSSTSAHSPARSMSKGINMAGF